MYTFCCVIVCGENVWLHGNDSIDMRSYASGAKLSAKLVLEKPHPLTVAMPVYWVMSSMDMSTAELARKNLYTLLSLASFLRRFNEVRCVGYE